MPNRTIYLNKQQDLDFARAQKAAKTLNNTSVGCICADALKAYADQSEPTVQSMEAARSAAMKGNSHVR